MIPVEVDRDEAREAAAGELADPVYQAAEPSLVERIGRWIAELFADVLSGLASVSPGGLAGLIVLALLVVLAVVIVRLRVGPVARSSRVRPALFSGPARSADDHRQAAVAAADRGELTEAVRERFRAVVRELEQRGVLDEVSGRTVAEIAAQAGLALPGLAAEFRSAAMVFDDVVYGDRPATMDGYRSMVELDDRVRAKALR